MTVYENVDQLTPEMIGTAITFKVVTESTRNTNQTVEHVTARLIAYAVAEEIYTAGMADGITRGYQILFEGYPPIKGSVYKPSSLGS